MFPSCLLASLGMVGVFNDDIAVRQYRFNVAVSLLTMGTKVAFVVGSNRAEGSQFSSGWTRTGLSLAVW